MSSRSRPRWPSYWSRRWPRRDHHTSEEAAELAETILRQLHADEYPHLAEMIIEHALKPGYDYAEEFEFGLDLILDGLERLRSTA